MFRRRQPTKVGQPRILSAPPAQASPPTYPSPQQPAQASQPRECSPQPERDSQLPHLSPHPYCTEHDQPLDWCSPPHAEISPLSNEEIAEYRQRFLKALDQPLRILPRTVYGHEPRRGDEVERWLLGWRDSLSDLTYAEREAKATIDDMIDDYRLHADTGTPLDTEVPER